MSPEHSPPPRCWAELDLDALRHNAEVARAQSGCEIMGVVKANAYGHGAALVAQALQDKVAMFGVANVTEAGVLRAAGIEAPLFLLSPCLPDERETAMAMDCHIGVSSLAEAGSLDAVAAKTGRKALVHVVLDTGMGRIGVPPPQWSAALVGSLLRLPHLKWMGLRTHLPSADEDADFTRSQIAMFRECVATAHEAGLRPRWVHLANSAGILGYAEAHTFCNLARPGLMLYGVSPLPEKQALLRPVLEWKTRVTLVRELPAGHGISYGRTVLTTRPTRVAVLACGYGDGYPRQVSGRGSVVVIHGERCPLLGRVTMDQMVVDITDLQNAPQVLPGDEAVLLGCQGTEQVTASEIAEKAGTIPWHVFTGITSRVVRVVAENHQRA